jgi:uncharacterized protein (DUF697 family)
MSKTTNGKVASGAAYSAWKTVQTVSPRAVEEEAEAGFKIAVVGTPEHRAWFRGLLLTDKATVGEREDVSAYISELDEGPEGDAAGGFSFTIYTHGPEEPLGVRGPNSVPFVGTFAEVAPAMLEARPTLIIALPRRLPAFRPFASKILIQSSSRANATIALISALPGILPWTGILLPASSIADVLLLTKNQLVLVMRLAAAHGQKPGYVRQAKELLGTVGSALGWRTVARELVGFVPAGVGAALKATIAYTGTVAVGQAAMWYYQTGSKPTAEQIKEFDKEAAAEAEAEVAALKERAKVAEPSDSKIEPASEPPQNSSLNTQFQSDNPVLDNGLSDTGLSNNGL